MIQVDDAIQTALNAVSPLGCERLPLQQANGYILAEDIASDIEMPPFDKSAMDGYALRAEDVANAPVELDVVGTVAAGVFPDFAAGPGQAVKIMTGAPLPQGSDSVQMIEKTEATAGQKVRILESVAPGKHVAVKGEVIRQAEIVLKKGTYLSPAVAGVLATVGVEAVPVYKRPKVGILVTGDELVEIHEIPKAGQIRNSNGHALFSQVLASGAIPVTLGIAPDNIADLYDKLEEGLSNDVLLISGGVSMGEFDFVEKVLDKLAVKIHFDKVNIKPGKPTVFGTTDTCNVFGLPGNPVSASTIYEIIVRPVLRKMLGHVNLHNLCESATLLADFRNTTRRVNYHPAITTLQEGKFQVIPVKSKGSADVSAFAASNSYLIASEENHLYNKGDRVEVMLRDEFWRVL